MDVRDAKLAMVQGALIVGVDLAKVRHWWRGIRPESGISVTPALCFENNRKGFEALVGEMRRAMERAGLSRAVVGLEPTGPHWRPLAQYLMEQPGIDVVLVNPYHVKRDKEKADNTRSKSDRKDCRIIADLVRNGEYLRVLWPRGAGAELRQLSVARLEAKKGWNAACNRVRSWLFERFPEFLEVFRDPFRQAARWVLEHCPTPAEVLAMPTEELVAGLKGAARGRVGQKRAAVLRLAAVDSIGYRDGAAGAKERLRGYLQDVDHWGERLASSEQAMEAWLKRSGMAESLLSVPGIGVVTAATFLGEVGDLDAFTHPKQIVKLAGFNVAEKSSGQSQGRAQLNKRGRPGLRLVLFLAAVNAVRHCPALRAFYDDLVGRSRKPLRKMQAMVAVACKLIRILWHLAKHRLTYDGAKALGRVRGRLTRAA